METGSHSAGTPRVAVRIVALMVILLMVSGSVIAGMLWRQSAERERNVHINDYHLASARRAEAVEKDISLIAGETGRLENFGQSALTVNIDRDKALTEDLLYKMRKNLDLIVRKERQYGEDQVQPILADLIEVDQAFRSLIVSGENEGELLAGRIGEVAALYQLRARQLARIHRKQLGQLRDAASMQRQQSDVVLMALLASVFLFGGWLVIRMFSRITASDTRLREGSALLSAVADSVPGGVLRCQTGASGDIKVLYQSQGLAAAFGRSVPLGDFDRRGILNSLHPEDRDDVLETVERSIKEREDFECDFRILIDGFGNCWRRVMASIDDTDADRQLWTVLVLDITEQKEAEEVMRIALSTADEANKSKSRFLASMSHEIRTPMNAVLGFAQILESSTVDELSERQKECIRQIMTGGQHLLSLIDDVLDLSRIESGRADITLTSVNPFDLVGECCTLVQSLAEKENIRLMTPGESDGVPDTLADRTRLRQILLNLMTNAIKYNKPGGSVTITVSVIRNSMIHFTVEDTGDGVPADMVDELFKPFSRLGREALNIEGTGIGLTISKMLVTQMDGLIGYESRPGEGSIFWIDIPIADESISALEKAPENVVKLVARREHRDTILYIEDNPSNVELIKRFLSETFDVSFFAAPNGEVGLALASEVRPDLVLLDLNLPGIDGYQVLEKLREMEETRNCPIIALTALAMDEDIRRGAKANFSSYITKPFDIKELQDKIRSALDGKRAAGRP